MGDSPYVLGHDSSELDRLARQAAVYAGMTTRFLANAGIVPGMRVLDLGSGAGDVAFLAAEAVGAAGSVLGLDRSEQAVEQARGRAEALGLGNVSFEVGDWTAPGKEGEFDAAVGRLTLMFQPDPVAAVRAAAKKVRASGVLALQEIDMGFRGRAVPPSPTYDRAWDWIAAAFTGSGAHVDVGMRLHGIFLDAGLPRPELTLEAPVTAAPGSPSPAHIAGVLRTLLPRVLDLGIASEEEVAIDTLEARIAAELDPSRAQIVGPTLVCAWARCG